MPWYKAELLIFKQRKIDTDDFSDELYKEVSHLDVHELEVFQVEDR